MGLLGKLYGDSGTKSFGPKNCILSAFWTGVKFPVNNCGLLADLGVVLGCGLGLEFAVFAGVFFHLVSWIFFTVLRCSLSSWDKGLSPPKKNDRGGGGLRFGGLGLGFGLFVVVVLVVVVNFFCLSKYERTILTASGLLRKADTSFSST